MHISSKTSNLIINNIKFKLNIPKHSYFYKIKKTIYQNYPKYINIL